MGLSRSLPRWCGSLAFVLSGQNRLVLTRLVLSKIGSSIKLQVFLYGGAIGQWIGFFVDVRVFFNIGE